MTVVYKEDMDGVDWGQMKSILIEDDFDNGRSPEQLRESFANSYTFSIAYDGQKIIGTARALSDGVCNAYIVDVWTYSPYRRQGIARQMLENMMTKMEGQHVYLFTDEDVLPFYKGLGFEEQGIGVSTVVGEWLVNNPNG
jgi:ribosomal protein S18 acetylase RimI-like enzyme